MVRWSVPSPFPKDVAFCPTGMFDELDRSDASAIVTGVRFATETCRRELSFR
jgi:hypothetical protein